MTMEEYLTIPIQIGREGIIPDYAKDNGKALVPKWNNEWDILSDKDLLHYFKGCVLLEEYLYPEGKGIGSATSTKFIYHTIQERHLDEDWSLADWAMRTASNPYVPFDTGNRHGATSAAELFGWRNSYERQCRREKVEAEQRRAEKKKQKAEAHMERLRLKEIRDKELGFK